MTQDCEYNLEILVFNLENVKSILNTYIPNDEVWAFGSRTRGTARKFSDLDLAVITEQPLDFNLYAALKEAFSESIFLLKSISLIGQIRATILKTH